MSSAGAAIVHTTAPRGVPGRRRARSRVLPALLALTAGLLAPGPAGGPAGAAPPFGLRDVDLATAAGYSVLAATTVTSIGATTLAGDLGLSPGTAVTGFPPGQVTPPASTHVADADAGQARSDLAAAYADAAARPTDVVTTPDLAGLVLGPGVHSGPGRSALSLTGPLVLDAQGDPNAVFIFQTESTLDTTAASTVSLQGGAQACNVFWQVGSSATLGASTRLSGSVLAHTSITIGHGTEIDGRALALHAAVTLDEDTFTTPSCAEVPRTRGRVTAEETGLGIAGVTVRLYQDGVGFTSDSATTDADGSYGFAADVPLGDRRVIFTDPSQDHVTEWWADSPLRSTSAPVAFDPAAEIVMDASLATGAEIEVTIDGGGTFGVHLYAQDPVGSSATQVRTTSTGVARFRGLRAGSYRVSVVDPTGARPTRWWDGATRSTATPIALGAGDVAVLPFDMTARNAISGVVADRDGPMVGVTVQVVGAASGAFVMAATTDGVGHYTIAGLAPATYKVVFRPPPSHVVRWSGDAETFATAAPVTVVDGGAEQEDADLPEASSLDGTVTSAGGAPIAGAKVSLYRDGAAVRTVVASASGAWSAAGLTPGSYVLLFVDPAGAHRSEYNLDRSRRADADPIVAVEGGARTVDAALTALASR